MPKPPIETTPAPRAEGHAPALEPRPAAKPAPSDDSEDSGPDTGADFLRKRRSPTFLALVGPAVAMAAGKATRYEEETPESELRAAVRFGVAVARLAEEEIEAGR